MDLKSVELFVRVVQRGSFSAASRHLDVPVATVSRRVSELERALDVRLLERSTRQLRLTEAGATLYEFASRGLDEMDAGFLALQNRESEIKGSLRLSVPPNFEPWWKLLSDFQQQYPQINVDIYVTERKIDFIEDGIDVALRVGDLEYLSAIARHLISYKHVLVATPEFIKKHGEPESPQELSNYPCAAWSNKHTPAQWTLAGKNIVIQPFICVNDFSHMRYLALHHSCITEQPPFLVNDLIANKQLVKVLTDYELPEFNVSLLYPSRKQLSRIARVYIDFCTANIDTYLT